MNAIGPIESIGYQFAGLFDVFGGYSLSLHLALVLVSLMSLVALVVTIAKIRGLSNVAVMSCARDILLAAGCFVTILFAIAGLYFMGRAFWTATMAKG